MKPPLYVRPLSDAERDALKAGLRSSDAFTLRRSQLLLASARGERPPAIAQQLGCSSQTVRNTIRAFNQRGLAALQEGSHRNHTIHLSFDKAGAAPGAGPSQPAGLRPSSEPLDPRAPGRGERSAGPDCAPHQRRDRPPCHPPVGQVLETGQTLDHQSRPGVRQKKRRRDRLIRLAARHPDWVLGFGDETWWSRLAQPSLHTWSEEPLRLVEQSVANDDPDPKALAAYGLLVRSADSQSEEVWLRFCDGRPVSALTIQFLADCCTRLAARGKTALLLIWDNASWHISKAVKGWIREHNRQAKHEGRGVRILACQLPVKAPWLNPLEPHWVHGKRAVVEPARLLPAAELEDRICAYFDCHPQEHLIAQQAA